MLGLALAQQGIETVILEQAPGPPKGLRGELIQPNGQRILDRLGVLDRLPQDAVRSVQRFHFFKTGGERLCTIDYSILPQPYNQAVVTLPNVAHHTILEAYEARAPGALRYDTRFTALRREGTTVAGVIAERHGERFTIEAKLVVGADGAFSEVRAALGIPTKLHRYREAYLIALLDNPDQHEDARYYVGRRTILGLFPAAARRMYVFYMISADSMPVIRAEGLETLRRRWNAIDPALEKIISSLEDWNQTAYMPTARVRTAQWAVDGAVLIGDAAHAMNPHASQGRMQAMEDAMALAEIIPDCLERGDYSAKALAFFEARRRRQVNMLQRLADQQVLFWNTANPFLGLLRDRVFRTLDLNRRLRYKVLATTAGLRQEPPFTLLDRVIAAGLLPDVHRDAVSEHLGTA